MVWLELHINYAVLAVTDTTQSLSVKAELDRPWPRTDLIDMLMEAPLQTGFLGGFTTFGDRVILDTNIAR